VLETISQPFIDREVTLALQERGYLVYDGDLTGRPVSNTSTTYPNVRFGHMSDAVHLGYQAAMVSIHSPTYSRLWLSVTPHPGDTVSCTQAEALMLAAEAKTGVRLWRRTDLLQQRLQSLQAQEQALQASLTQSQQALEQAQDQLQETLVQAQYWQQIVGELEAIYCQKQRPERPHSRLAQARARLAVQQRRVPRREKAVTRVQKRLERHQVELAALVAQRQSLEQRLACFEQENTANPAPIRAIFRLDAGFGTPDNVTLLIEMGYEVYTKPYSHRVTTGLRRRVTTAMTWTRVGANAEMVAWASIWVGKYPYPLDVALERFYTGQTMALQHLVALRTGSRDLRFARLVSHLQRSSDDRSRHQGGQAGLPNALPEGALRSRHFPARAFRHLRRQFCPLGSLLAAGAVSPDPRGRAGDFSGWGQETGAGGCPHLSLGDLATGWLFVKVHGSQRLCWHISAGQQRVGFPAPFALIQKLGFCADLNDLPSGCTKLTLA
jgi:hypothetical protein